MKRHWMFKVTMMTILFIGFVVVAVAAVSLLWNALVPEIFGGTQITWVQALGLLVLARLLVGSGAPQWIRRAATVARPLETEGRRHESRGAREVES